MTGSPDAPTATAWVPCGHPGCPHLGQWSATGTLVLCTAHAVEAGILPEPDYATCTDDELRRLAEHANTARVRANAGDALRERYARRQLAVIDDARALRDQDDADELQAVRDEAHQYRTAYYELVEAVWRAHKNDCMDELLRLVRTEAK
jgi:hypothetical protein